MCEVCDAADAGAPLVIDFVEELGDSTCCLYGSLTECSQSYGASLMASVTLTRSAIAFDPQRAFRFDREGERLRAMMSIG